MLDVCCTTQGCAYSAPNRCLFRTSMECAAACGLSKQLLWGARGGPCSNFGSCGSSFPGADRPTHDLYVHHQSDLVFLVRQRLRRSNQQKQKNSLPTDSSLSAECRSGKFPCPFGPLTIQFAYKLCHASCAGPIVANSFSFRHVV